MPPAPERSGILYLVSGPSGSGKTTLCHRLAAAGEARYSISCTTRPIRPDEVDGADYHFLTREDFQARAAKGDFLEHAEVHGNLYGTLKSEVLAHLAAGADIVMDIDIRGADLVRANPDPAIRRALLDIFIMPGDEAELERRLAGRATDSPETIALRLKNAIVETARWPDYTYRMISRSRQEDFERFLTLLQATRLKTALLREKTKN